MNNIFHEPREGALSLAPDLMAQGSVARRNIVSVGTMSIDAAPAGLALVDNLVATDPALVDAEGHDLGAFERP